MIFQALISLYDRLAEDNKVPHFGFSMEEIGFVINLDSDGNMLGEPEDLRVKVKGGHYDYRLSEVPFSNKVDVRSGNAATTPNFMVDKADYIFGMSGKSRKEKYRQSFQKHIEEVCGTSDDAGFMAVRKFLSQWNPEDSLALGLWKEISGAHGKWVAFRLDGDSCFVHERPAIKKLWRDFISQKTYARGISFVDGQEHDLQEQYAQFKFGTGASLVSFNEVAYESYGKKKGANAPISVKDEFKSSTALKYLFRSSQRLRIGDAVTVYWAEKPTEIEEIFGQILDPTVMSESAAVPVRKFLEAVQKGVMPENIEHDKELKFYILGLSLNKARLALRFWFACTVEDLFRRFHDHFSNLAIEPVREDDIQFPGIWHLLKETARESKNISPVLGGSLIRSILTGGAYPQSLYHGVLNRIRADGRINYLRAAILKAVLVRNFNKEVPMSLDTERMETGYLLGRLFAVLEKAQSDALGQINTTIKDRFFTAASATPASVFPRLLNLAQHHIEKAEYGYMSEKRIAEIMEHIDSFPAHLNLQDQGLFAIGYYHQKNAMARDIKEAAARKKAA